MSASPARKPAAVGSASSCKGWDPPPPGEGDREAYNKRKKQQNGGGERKSQQILPCHAMRCLVPVALYEAGWLADDRAASNAVIVSMNVRFPFCCCPVLHVCFLS